MCTFQGLVDVMRGRSKWIYRRHPGAVMCTLETLRLAAASSCLRAAGFWLKGQEQLCNGRSSACWPDSVSGPLPFPIGKVRQRPQSQEAAQGIGAVCACLPASDTRRWGAGSRAGLQQWRHSSLAWRCQLSSARCIWRGEARAGEGEGQAVGTEQGEVTAEGMVLAALGRASPRCRLL